MNDDFTSLAEYLMEPKLKPEELFKIVNTFLELIARSTKQVSAKLARKAKMERAKAAKAAKLALKRAKSAPANN